MVTYEAMNMLIQFGVFLTTTLTAIVAIIALVTFWSAALHAACML